MTPQELFSAVIEKAAKVCDDVRAHSVLIHDNTTTADPDHARFGHQANGADECAAAIRALTPAAIGLDLGGDGFVLVPREPTEAMIDDASKWFYAYSLMRDIDKRGTVESAYKAMLAAAPPSGIATNKGGDDER